MIARLKYNSMIAYKFWQAFIVILAILMILTFGLAKSAVTVPAVAELLCASAMTSAIYAPISSVLGSGGAVWNYVVLVIAVVGLNMVIDYFHIPEIVVMLAFTALIGFYIYLTIRALKD